MVKTDVLNTSGEKTGTITLPTEIFAAKVNPELMALAVRVYLSNQRRSRAKAKTRGEINRTKAKWYRQKGTGRARHGARSAPLFVGGGAAHGPKGIENYKLKINKKMRKAALFSALTSKLKEKNILVIEGLEGIEPKTKNMVGILEKLGNVKSKAREKILLILPKPMENVARSSRNIKDVKPSLVGSLNTYKVLNGKKLIFLKESIVELKKHFLPQ